MLPCRYVNVSLVSLVSDSHIPQQDCTEVKEGGHPAAYARVFHIDEDGHDNFVKLSFLEKLYHETYGLRETMPRISSATRAILRWCYPAMPEVVRTTAHQVRAKAEYHIILRKIDWVTPIQQLRDQQYRNVPPRYLTSQEQDEECLRAGSVSDATSSQWSVSDPSSPQSTVDEDSQDLQGISGYCPADVENSQIWFEIVDSKPHEASSGKLGVRYYWKWSDKAERFVHQNEDGSITPLVLD